MVDVGRNDHAPGGNFVADKFGSDLLALGNEHHLFGEQALARKMHLRHIAVASAHSLVTTLGDPLRPRLRHASTVVLAAIGYIHDLQSPADKRLLYCRDTQASFRKALFRR